MCAASHSKNVSFARRDGVPDQCQITQKTGIDPARIDAAMVNPHATVAPEVPGRRRCPIGAEVAPDGSIHARVWAPHRTAVSFVEVRLDDSILTTVDLQAEGNGYFSGAVPGAKAGALYKFRLDESGLFPDPVSRFQPAGPHGPSQIIDPRQYAWRDASWRGPSLAGAVLY